MKNFFVFIFFSVFLGPLYSQDFLAPQSYVQESRLKKMIMEYFSSPNHFNPQALIAILKNDPVLSNDFPRSVGVEEGYSLEQHTFMVLNQFETYFAQQKLPAGLNPDFFRILLALHDAGKPRAIREGNKAMEHPYTLALINKLRADLPFRDEAIDVIAAIIKKDVIGMYLRDKLSLEGAERQILLLAQNLKIPLYNFFQYLTIFYQCDTASYTADAGGQKSLEFLFTYRNGGKVFDPQRKRLLFSQRTESKFSILEARIIAQSRKFLSPAPDRLQSRQEIQQRSV